MSDPLLDLPFPDEPKSAWRGWPRYAGDVEARVAQAVAAELGIEDTQTLPEYGPDVVGQTGTRSLNVGIELKLWRYEPKNIANRVNEALSQAVRYRREFAGGVHLGLMVLMVGGQDHGFEPDAGQTQHVFKRMGTLLRRGPQDAGFDRLVVGLKGRTHRWIELDADGREYPLADFAAAAARIADRSRQPSLPFEVHAGKPAQPGPRAHSTPSRLLLVANEWRSRHGGISTFNRELARALADAGCEVHVAVPQADSEERDDASESGVSLVTPDGIPGIDGHALLLTRPRFVESEYMPDAVIGHGRILGSYAYAAQNLFFPLAKRLHIVHMDAERLEAAKESAGGPSRMTTATERKQLEVELALSADVVAGVGPLLTESIRDDMRGFRKEAPPVIDLRPGLRDWGGTVDPNDPPVRRQVLLLARAEDVTSKGIDIATRAVAWAAARLGNAPGEPPVLVVRGVPVAEADAVKQRLDAIAAPGAQVILRPYTSQEDTLRPDLWQSRVVVMPSRHEGFGLVAYEAIAAGVPVLVSRESGLARLLAEIVTDGERAFPREILSVSGDENALVELWGNAIHDALIDPEAAFARAANIRCRIDAATGWDSAVENLLNALHMRSG